MSLVHMSRTNAVLRWVISSLAHSFTTTENSDKALTDTIFCQAKLAGLSLQ